MLLSGAALPFSEFTTGVTDSFAAKPRYGSQLFTSCIDSVLLTYVDIHYTLPQISSNSSHLYRNCRQCLYNAGGVITILRHGNPRVFAENVQIGGVQ